MSTLFAQAHPRAMRLFDEDFDLPPAPEPVPEPEIIEPVFTAGELEAARADAWREGHETALAASEAAGTAAAREALAAIAARLDTAREAASAIAEEAADAIARLVMNGFAAAFPALAARQGETELRAVIHAILPTLHQEPRITVRLAPHLAPLVAREIAALDADLVPRVRIVPTDAMPPGDLRITWRNGSAARDTAALWSRIETILAPAGLLATGPAAKEVAHGE
jgi:flagellar biosynthesis/type III secretory pathway protein FliH